MSVLLTGGATSASETVKLEEVDLVPEGESMLSGGIRFEQDRDFTSPGDAYDNTRYQAIDLRMGILDNFEGQLGVNYSSNSGSDSAPSESGIEGITLGGKIQWHPNISTTFTGKFNGSEDVYPYGSDDPSFSANVPVKFEFGDGVFHANGGLTLQSGNAMFNGNSVSDWENHVNYGFGYSYDLNQFSNVSFEVTGHTATVEDFVLGGTAAGTVAGGTVAGGTTPTPTAGGTNFDVEDSLELVIGSNIRLARGVRMKPSAGFALMEGSPDYALGLQFEIDMGGRHFPTQTEEKEKPKQRFTKRKPVGGLDQDEEQDEETMDREETSQSRDEKKKDQIDQHMNKGYEAAQNGNLERALDHYRKAMEIDPKNVLVRSNLGSIYYRKGDYEEAIKHYREATRQDPEDTFSLLYLGASHHKLGNRQTARRYFKRVLEIDSDHQQAQDWLQKMNA